MVIGVTPPQEVAISAMVNWRESYMRLAGELDDSNRDAVIAALHQGQARAAAAGTTILQVDLASLRFCDVAGLRALRAAARAEPGRW